MSDSFTQNAEDFKAWSYLITKAITCAIADTVPTTGQQISIDSIKVGRVNAADMPDLLGGPDALAIGTYSALSGTVNGHIMISHQPELTLRLMNVKSDTLTRLSEKEQCTLGEIDNAIRNTFLSAIQDILAIPLRSSLPVVLVDKATALLDIARTEFLREGDSVFAVEVMLTINRQTTQGIFIIMLDHNVIRLAQNLMVTV